MQAEMRALLSGYSSKYFEKAGIKISDPSAPVIEEEQIKIIKKMEDTYSREREIEEGTRGIIAKRIARKNELSNSIKERVEEFVVNISNKPSDSSNDYSGRYVKAGENVESVMGQVIAKFIDNVINKTSLVKHVSVAQDQLADLQDTNRDFKTNIRVEQVERTPVTTKE